MNVALRRPMTLAEFLEWEERQEFKHEFDGFQPVAMVGVRVAHSTIQANLLFQLVGQLRGKPCRPHGSELKIEVAGSIRYPDALVVCTTQPVDALVVRDPVVVFEILSESTSHTDLVVKNDEYRATPSIQRYVVLEQTHVGAVVFTRKGEDWTAKPFRAGDSIVMAEIGVTLAMADIYEGLNLPPDELPSESS